MNTREFGLTEQDELRKTPDELGLTSEDREACLKVLEKENPKTLLKLVKIILVNRRNLPIDITEKGTLLIKPKSNSTAERCREMGLKVGDTIFRDMNSSNKEVLKILFLGKTQAVFDYELFYNKASHNKFEDSRDWHFDNSDWYKLED